MLAYQEIYPKDCHPQNVFMAQQMDEFYNHNLMNCYVYGRYLPSFHVFIKVNQIDAKIEQNELAEIEKMRNDFICLSYYQSMTVDHTKVNTKDFVNVFLKAHIKNPYLERTEFDWEIDPLGFRNVITKISNRYHIPIFPVENGIGARETLPEDGGLIEDDYRITYHRNHINAMMESIELDGADVMGYLGWGLIDIPSSSGDMEKRYGTVFVNRTNHDLKDMRRVPKKSFAWLKAVIASNGEKVREEKENEN
jgi:6-phospho-beta-glucosidase